MNTHIGVIADSYAIFRQWMITTGIPKVLAGKVFRPLITVEDTRGMYFRELIYCSTNELMDYTPTIVKRRADVKYYANMHLRPVNKASVLHELLDIKHKFNTHTIKAALNNAEITEHRGWLIDYPMWFVRLRDLMIQNEPNEQNRELIRKVVYIDKLGVPVVRYGSYDASEVIRKALDQMIEQVAESLKQ